MKEVSPNSNSSDQFSESSTTTLSSSIPTLSYSLYFDSRFKQKVIAAIEHLCGRRRLETMYRRVISQLPKTDSFWLAALNELDISVNYEQSQLANIPPTGPLVVIANHPFGVIDGIAICHLISLVRPSFKILVNEVLCREERIEPHVLPVDFRETKDAVQRNITTKKEALQTLAAGGVVIIFPAGGVATAPRGIGRAKDLEWKPFAARLIQESKATVVPLFFHGQNSRLFQFVSQLSLTLRLALLLYEVSNKIGTTVHVTIGESIPYQQLKSQSDRRELLNYLRAKTFCLADRIESR